MQNDSHNFGHFGEHLTVDGYFGNYGKLNDRNLVYKCLDELPTILGMQKLIMPIVKLAEEPMYAEHKDPGGWSGVIVHPPFPNSPISEGSYQSIRIEQGGGERLRKIYTKQVD